MRIGLAIAAYHPGNPSEFLRAAFYKLGHVAQIINQEELYRAYVAGYFDAIVGVDSGRPLDLRPLLRMSDIETKPKLAFWFIDYRHNKDRAERSPNDVETLLALKELGGYCFQSQQEDYQDSVSRGISECSWLPLAADPDHWNNLQSVTSVFDLSFVGNVWDEARANALKRIADSGLKFHCVADGTCWGQNAVATICSARVGFNISSFFGSGFDYDLNMRFFEVLSTGRPLITNYVPAIDLIFKTRPNFIRTYRSVEEVLPVITQALADKTFMNSGADAKSWILAEHTYQHRAKTILEKLLGR